MINEFKKIYSEYTNIKDTFCPYRVCPLGAHIDHQYGVVTGFALDKGIRIMFCETNDGTVEAASKNFPEKISFNVKDIPEFQGDWADYIRGAAYSLGKKYKLTKGVKALIEGTLPVGGLSSSAALILAFMSALCDANDIELTNKEKIYIAQAAENEYVGVSCGKLDQSCEVLCKKDHLLFLDNKTDEYELIPQNSNMPPCEFAIVFSGVERTLVGSAFNMRVDELKSASYALKAFAGMEYGKFKDSRLRDVPVEIFEEVLKHEEFVTSRINALYDVAEEVRDRAAMKFLDWYLKEQVEEEASVGGVLATLKLIGDDKKALLLLDKDLATRTFTAPVIG